MFIEFYRSFLMDHIWSHWFPVSPPPHSYYKQILQNKRIDPADMRIKSGWWGDHSNAYSAGKLKASTLRATFIAKAQEWVNKFSSDYVNARDIPDKIDGPGLYVFKVGGCPVVRLSVVRLSGCPAVRLSGCPVVRLADWPVGRLAGWPFSYRVHLVHFFILSFPSPHVCPKVSGLICSPLFV